MAAERNQIIEISGDIMRAVMPPSLPPLEVDPEESDYEPETEALEALLEDMQTAYASVVQHLGKCTRGLKEMDAALKATAVQELELSGAIGRAKEGDGRFGTTLLAELEKLDARGRVTSEASDTLSNGHAESLPASRF